MDQLVIVVQTALLEGTHSNGSSSSGTGGRKIRNETAPEALQCVSDMVLGLGEPFHDRVVALLEPMLQGGLTAELINTLTVIATYMPYQRPIVQQRLLEESTKVLGGVPKQILSPPDYMYRYTHKKFYVSNTHAACTVRNIPFCTN